MKISLSLILASGSPRRQQILKDAGYHFIVSPKNTDESYPPALPCKEVAQYLAVKKAQAFNNELKENELVITADTIVLLNNTILNKPSGPKEAFEMLSTLSGKKHEVVTGVCLYSSQHKISFSDTTEVYFKELSNEEINYYIEYYEPFDKAGAYGIQEWIGMIGIEKIIGSYFNVMGLPIHRVAKEINGLIG